MDRTEVALFRLMREVGEDPALTGRTHLRAPLVSANRQLREGGRAGLLG